MPLHMMRLSGSSLTHTGGMFEEGKSITEHHTAAAGIVASLLLQLIVLLLVKEMLLMMMPLLPLRQERPTIGVGVLGGDAVEEMPARDAIGVKDIRTDNLGHNSGIKKASAGESSQLCAAATKVTPKNNEGFFKNFADRTFLSLLITLRPQEAS